MFLISSSLTKTLKLGRQPIPPSFSSISLPPRFLSLQSAMSNDCSSTGETLIHDDSTPKTPHLTYPTPLSPPLPSLSKEVELARAMSASSKSNLFSLSRDDVVFEDEWLIVVNKPQGIYCENVLSSVPRLLQSSPISDQPVIVSGKVSGAAEFHLANRLDRDTSGVMVITKSHKVAAKLVKAFTNHKVKKTYIALCVGLSPKWDRIRIKSGHGRSKFGAWRVYALSDAGKSLPGGSLVRDMETVFELLSVNGEAPECSVDSTENVIVVEGKSEVESEQVRDELMVRAFPRSGRTHQIRLHCQYLGIPIMGDVKYHGVYEWKGSVCDGHTLHAESLSFEHPVTGVPVLIKAPLPLWAMQVSQPS